VLVLGVGRATRLLRYLSGVDKEYHGEVVLGSTTDTLDDDGEVTGRFDMSGVTLDAVAEAAKGLTGEIDQKVPMVSAVKVDGQRLHRLARAGVEVETPVRRVRVDRLEVTPGSEPGTIRIDVQCSSGTYVRALAADLGTALGGGAHLRGLRRTRVGLFGEADAHTLRNIEVAFDAGDHSFLRPPLDALGFERAQVTGDAAVAVTHGRPLLAASIGAQGGPVALLDAAGDLLAVYERAVGDDLARPTVVLGSSQGDTLRPD
jgi:tRNA pseudouridine55 synthase